MLLSTRSKITGFGAYTPERILTNADLETIVDTTDEWIVQRTGVRERHITRADEFSSDMAIKAVIDLRDRCGVHVSDVDMIVVTTFTPDHFTPHISAVVQGAIGIKGAGTFDLGAGCTGFEYALVTADALVSSGHFSKVMIIAAEAVSKVVDYTDRSTCILFGDAAAACVVERTEGKGSFLASSFNSNGEMAAYVTTTNHSNTVNGVPVVKHNIFEQDGQMVYKYVARNVPQGVDALLKRAGLTLDDIDWFVPHSANMRMIEGIAKKIHIPAEKVLTSVEYYGNTSSASIPLALSLAQKAGKIKSGDKALLYGFGGGLTHGGTIVEL